ncbi:MAG: SRPBCC family protein [Chthoniobacterales bacterium]
MAIYTLNRAQILPKSLDWCWSFFSDPRNLARITPPALGFKVKSELPAEVYPGLMIRYTVSPLFRIPVAWLTEITRVEKPHYFVDEQRIGPYRVWHHEHFFRAINSEETEVRDLVHYVPPFGPLGAILNRLMIRPQLEQIFDFREQTLTSLVSSAHA